MFRIAILILPLMIFAASPARSSDTCAVADAICTVELGEYAIRLPDAAGTGTRFPALFYFHGAGGSGPGVMRNTKMVNTFLNRGYAVIAPTALDAPDGRHPRIWSFLPSRRSLRDEKAFTSAVLEDAALRFNIDRERVLMSGFSVGGSLTWYLACQDPRIASAYAPVAGAFWRPHPDAIDCAGPIKMLHTHGWRDGTVPLEGRPIRKMSVVQGDVFYGLQILREINGCEGMRATKFDTSGKFWRRIWEKCTSGSALELALHTGGHGVPDGWADMAIDWFEALPPRK